MRTLEAVTDDAKLLTMRDSLSELERQVYAELIGHVEERLRVNVGLVAENKELRRKLREARCQECARPLEDA